MQGAVLPSAHLPFSEAAQVLIPQIYRILELRGPVKPLKSLILPPYYIALEPLFAQPGLSDTPQTRGWGPIDARPCPWTLSPPRGCALGSIQHQGCVCSGSSATRARLPEMKRRLFQTKQTRKKQQKNPLVWLISPSVSAAVPSD